MHERLKRIRANAIETVEKDEASGAFGQLEKQKIDVEVALALKPKLEQIIERNQERKDDFTLNQEMRKRFRK